MSSRGASGHDAALVDDRDEGVELFDFVEVVRRVDDRRPTISQTADEREDLVARSHVGTGRRLVEQDERRPVHERDRRVQPAAFTARELRGATAEEIGEPERRGDVVDPIDELSTPQPGEPGEEPQVVAHGERQVDARVLGREADELAGRMDIPGDVDAADAYEAGIGRRSPAMIDTRVVLPAPFGPRSARIVPGSRVRSMPSSATFDP